SVLKRPTGRLRRLKSPERGGPIELEPMDSANSPLGVYSLYGGRHHQLRRRATEEIYRMGGACWRCSRSPGACSRVCTCSCCRMAPSGPSADATALTRQLAG